MKRWQVVVLTFAAFGLYTGILLLVVHTGRFTHQDMPLMTYLVQLQPVTTLTPFPLPTTPMPVILLPLWFVGLVALLLIVAAVALWQRARMR